MVDVVNTLTTVLAWLGCALIDVRFAIVSGEAGFANACVSVNSINALSTVLALVWVTFINIDFAVFSLESRLALTCSMVDPICTLTAVFARFQSALVNVGFAVLSRESSRAVAQVIVDKISALSAVLARGSRLQSSATTSSFSCERVGRWLWCRCNKLRQNCAFINVDFAIDTFESSDASAGICVNKIRARSAVLARFIFALIDVDFAIFSFVSSKALAFIVVNTINASGSVLARLRCALVNIDFAVLSGETVWALAAVSVVVIFELNASSIVLTRIVPTSRRQAQRNIFLPPSLKGGAFETFATFGIAEVETLVEGRGALTKLIIVIGVTQLVTMITVPEDVVLR
jgi:hypothetical protein